MRSHLIKNSIEKPKSVYMKKIVQAKRDLTFINPGSRWHVFRTSQIDSPFLGISWYVLLTSHIGQSHLGASWYASRMSRFGQSLLGTSWYVFSTSRLLNFI